jgi:alpha-1,3-rhamnosyltransferase
MTINYQKGVCSICCLGYNHVKFLEQLFRSVWEGEYKQIEIIALDDGSTDGSQELLNSLAAESPFPMTVVLQNNTGRSSINLNRMFKMAKGEFILFISMDDYLFPDTVSKKLSLMNTNDKIAFIGCILTIYVDKFGNYIKPVSTMIDINASINDLIEFEYNKFGPFFMQNCIVRTDVFNLIGGFDEEMLSDDFVPRTKLFMFVKNNPEYSFVLLNEPGLCYRLHDNNLHKNIIRQIRSLSEFFAKYWPERETPLFYAQLVRYMISITPFEEYILELTFNYKSIKLLYNSDIKRAILKSLILTPKIRQKYKPIFYTYYFIKSLFKKIRNILVKR